MIFVLLMMILVIITAAALRLGITKRLTIAAVRATLQLAVIGLIIGWVFKQNTWYAVGSLLVVMTLIAGVTAGGQLGNRLSKQTLVLSVMMGAVTGIALIWLAVGAVGLREWDARYLVPLGGMLLGNALTASVLAAERIRPHRSAQGQPGSSGVCTSRDGCIDPNDQRHDGRRHCQTPGHDDRTNARRFVADSGVDVPVADSRGHLVCRLQRGRRSRLVVFPQQLHRQ